MKSFLSVLTKEFAECSEKSDEHSSNPGIILLIILSLILQVGLHFLMVTFIKVKRARHYQSNRIGLKQLKFL